MSIIGILERQYSVLLKLNRVLIEEKEILIHNDGEALSRLVEEKMKLIDILNEEEKTLMDATRGRKISELTHEEVSFEKINPIVKSMETLSQEIRNHQETNRMLTMQSIGYMNKVLYSMKEAIDKTNPVYNRTGIYKQNQNFNAAIDKSV
ncbi:MAG: flagellar protein FlgN [Peptostreptococcales bacterium]